MPMQIPCPGCRQSLNIPDDLVGQLAKCPACLTEFTASPEAHPPQLDQGIRAADIAPPPLRAPLPERVDLDEWTDDIELRRLTVYRQRARSALLGPAICLMILSVLGLAAGILVLIFGASAIDVARSPEERIDVLRNLVRGPIVTVSSIIMLLGGISMARAKKHGLCRISAVLAMVPCTSPCCLIGLPIGIWAMVTLNKTDIKRGFD